MMLSGGSDPADGEPAPDGAAAAETGAGRGGGGATEARPPPLPAPVPAAADWLRPALRQLPLGLPPMGAGSGGGKSPGL